MNLFSDVYDVVQGLVWCKVGWLLPNPPQAKKRQTYSTSPSGEKTSLRQNQPKITPLKLSHQTNESLEKFI